MDKNKTIVISPQFIKYYNGKEQSYKIIDDIFDENYEIISSKLVLLINHIFNKKVPKNLNIVLIDPNFSIEPLDPKIDDENNLKALYMNGYSSKIFRNSNSYQAFSLPKNNVEAIKQVSIDLGINIHLYTFAEAVINGAKGIHPNKVFLFHSKDVYFFYVINGGSLRIFNYMNTKTLIERAISNIKKIDSDIDIVAFKEDQYLQNAMESVYILKQYYGEFNGVDLDICFESDDEKIETYFNGLAFENINKVNFFDILDNMELKLNYLEKNRKSNNLIKIIPVALLIIVLISVIIYSKNLGKLKDSYYEKQDEMIERNRELETGKIDIENMNAEVEERNNELNELLSLVQEVDGRKIIDIFDELSKVYEVKKIISNYNRAEVVIFSLDKIDNKYTSFVTKMKQIESGFEYTLSFEVQNGSK